MLKVKSHNTYLTTEMLIGDIINDVKRKLNVSVVVQGDIVKPIIKAMMNIDDIDIQLLDYDFTIMAVNIILMSFGTIIFLNFGSRRLGMMKQRDILAVKPIFIM